MSGCEKADREAATREGEGVASLMAKMSLVCFGHGAGGDTYPRRNWRLYSME